MKNEIIPAIQWSKALLPILAQGHELRIPLMGGSMRPLLVGGRDEAIIASVQAKNLKRGDIALYVRQDGTHVLHRIHHIKNGSFFMLGDAQTDIEGPIHGHQILAMATSLVRKGKKIDCSQLSYRLLSGLWLLMRPLRPLLMQIIALRRKLK